MSAKLLVAAGVLLVVLFVVLVVMGADRSRAPLPSPGGVDRQDFPTLARLDERFGRNTTDLDTARLAGACGRSPDAIVVPPGLRCAVDLLPAEKPKMAFLVLRFEGGSGLSVLFQPRDPPEGSEDPKPQRVKTGEIVRVPVRPAGGMLVFTCGPLAPCVVRIL